MSALQEPWTLRVDAVLMLVYFVLVALSVRFWVPLGPLRPDQQRRRRICRRVYAATATLSAGQMVWTAAHRRTVDRLRLADSDRGALVCAGNRCGRGRGARRTDTTGRHVPRERDTFPMNTSGDDDDLEQEWGPVGPFRGNRVHVMAAKCPTCIFRPGNMMQLRGGRVQQMVATCQRRQGVITCHSTLGTTEPAICRGFFEAYGGHIVALRLAAALKVLIFDPVPVTQEQE